MQLKRKKTTKAPNHSHFNAGISRNKMLWLLFKMVLWQQIRQKFLTVFRHAIKNIKIKVIIKFILQKRRPFFLKKKN